VSAPFKFAVSIAGMDLEAWADEYGMEPELAASDFGESMVDQIKGCVDHFLQLSGYEVEVDVNQTI
jgi:hypothetical protein